ncbi:cadherin-related family member 1-like [Mya arenaria]|uniref:cadherin-related family member 1-like n=1 Tax=Mya arenaria TaxID=6604 RepID=UPI0022E7DE0C|nr:cadherin-related family member 1-like [Mya arenaria]
MSRKRSGHRKKEMTTDCCSAIDSNAAVTEWTAPGAISGATGGFTILAANAIAEGSAAGTALFTATATVGGTASYVLVNDAGGKGTIDASSGVVSLATGQTLDFATDATLIFEVEATDSVDSGTGTATITLPISNVAPAYAEAQFTACVEDNSGADTLVGTYTATDASNTITYSINSGDTNSDFVYGTDGTLKVATSKTLDKGTMATYTLVLHAADPEPLAGSATVTLSVESTCSGAEAFGAMLASVLLSAIVSYLI